MTLPDLTLPNINVPNIGPIHIPDITLPSFSVQLPSINIDIPVLRLPFITLPDITLPTIQLPSIQIPSFTLPNFPSVTISFKSIQLPDLSLGDIHLSLGDLQAPNFQLSDLTSGRIPLPDIQLPQIALPKLTLPSFEVEITVTVPNQPNYVKDLSLSLPSFALETWSLGTLSGLYIPIPILTLPDFSLPDLNLSASVGASAKYTNFVGQTGFQIDIFKAANVVNMLLNKPFNIMEYDILPQENISGDLNFNLGFGVGGVGINGSLDASAGMTLAPLSIVYDSTGISEMVAEVWCGGIVDGSKLLDGLYIPVPANGQHFLDVYLNFAASASANLGIASAFLKGYLNGDIYLDVNDPNPNNGGKLRLNDIMALTDNFSDPAKLLSMFNAGVNISAGLDAGGTVGIKPAIISVSLSSLGISPNINLNISLAQLFPQYFTPQSSGGTTPPPPPPPPPTLATPEVVNGQNVLQVNIGPNASSRIGGSQDDTSGANITVSGSPGNVQISGYGVTDQVYSGQYAYILIVGGPGADVIDCSGLNGVPVHIYGGGGDDTIKTGNANAYVETGDGNVTVDLGNGNNTVIGGAGSETITAAKGSNNTIDFSHSQGSTYHGGGGNDWITGSSYADTIVAGPGRGGSTHIVGGGPGSFIKGGDGNNNYLQAGDGDGISLQAGDGTTLLIAGFGNQTLIGGAGDDTIKGGVGTQILRAGSGNTTIIGGFGTQTLSGGGGNDILRAGIGDQKLYGGGGNTILFGGIGNDLLDGHDNDTGGGSTGVVTYYGGIGNNTVVAAFGDKWIDGGSPGANGQGGVNHLTISSRFASINNGTLTPYALQTATTTTPYINFSSIDVQLGNLGNILTVNGISMPFSITGGNGGDNITILSLSAPSPVEINLGSGDDTLTVKDTQSVLNITNAGYAVAGDTLVIDLDPPINPPLRTGTLNGNTISVVGMADVNYQNIQFVNFILGNAADVFTIKDTAHDATRTTFQGGSGYDNFYVDKASTQLRIYSDDSATANANLPSTLWLIIPGDPNTLPTGTFNTVVFNVDRLVVDNTTNAGAKASWSYFDGILSVGGNQIIDATTGTKASYFDVGLTSVDALSLTDDVPVSQIIQIDKPQTTIQEGQDVLSYAATTTLNQSTIGLQSKSNVGGVPEAIGSYGDSTYVVAPTNNEIDVYSHAIGGTNGGSGLIQVLDSTLRGLQHLAFAQAVAVSPDGSYVYVASADGILTFNRDGDGTLRFNSFLSMSPGWAPTGYYFTADSYSSTTITVTNYHLFVSTRNANGASAGDGGIGGQVIAFARDAATGVLGASTPVTFNYLSQSIAGVADALAKVVADAQETYVIMAAALYPGRPGVNGQVDGTGDFGLVRFTRDTTANGGALQLREVWAGGSVGIGTGTPLGKVPDNLGYGGIYNSYGGVVLQLAYAVINNGSEFVTPANDLTDYIQYTWNTSSSSYAGTTQAGFQPVNSPGDGQPYNNPVAVDGVVATSANSFALVIGYANITSYRFNPSTINSLFDLIPGLVANNVYTPGYTVSDWTTTPSGVSIVFSPHDSRTNAPLDGFVEFDSSGNAASHLIYFNRNSESVVRSYTPLAGADMVSSVQYGNEIYTLDYKYGVLFSSQVNGQTTTIQDVVYVPNFFTGLNVTDLNRSLTISSDGKWLYVGQAGRLYTAGTGTFPYYGEMLSYSVPTPGHLAQNFSANQEDLSRSASDVVTANGFVYQIIPTFLYPNNPGQGPPDGAISVSKQNADGTTTFIVDPNNRYGRVLEGNLATPLFATAITTSGGTFLYVGNTTPSAASSYTYISIFKQNADGTLTAQTGLQDPSGVLGLGNIGEMITATLAGGQTVLYVTGRAQNAIVTFAIDPATGALTYLSTVKQGVRGVRGLTGIYGLALSNNQKYLVATGNTGNTAVVFGVDPVSGKLTYLQRLLDGSGTTQDLSDPQQVLFAGTNVVITTGGPGPGYGTMTVFNVAQMLPPPRVATIQYTGVDSLTTTNAGSDLVSIRNVGMPLTVNASGQITVLATSPNQPTTINAIDGSDIDVRDTGVGSQVTINGGTTSNIFNIWNTEPGGSLTLNGGPGTNTYNVSGYDPNYTRLGSPVTINGGSGADTLNFYCGPQTANPANPPLPNGSVSVTGQPNGVNYTSVETINIFASPVAVIATPAPFAEGQGVSLDASGSIIPSGRTAVSYQWDIDGYGSFGEENGAKISLTWAELEQYGIDHAGTYQVAVDVTLDTGASDVGIVTLTITDTPPTLTASGTPTINGGSVYTLSLSSSTPANDPVQQWDVSWGDGTPDTIVYGPVTSALHTFATVSANTTYTIVATAFDDEGQYSVTQQVTVLQPAAPTTTSINGPGTAIEGALYTLILAVAGPNAANLLNWDILWGDGHSDVVSGAATSVTHTFANSGLFVIQAFSQWADGSISIIPTDVNVDVPFVAPKLSATGNGNSTVSEGQSFSLNLSATDPNPITQWTINWGDGTTSFASGNNPSPTHVYATAGTYNVQVQAADVTGTYPSLGSSLAGPTVTVNPVAPTISLAGSASSVSEEATYTLNFNATGGDGVTGWLVAWGDGTTSTVAINQTQATHVYTQVPATEQIQVTGYTIPNPTGYTVSKTVQVLGVTPAPTITGDPAGTFENSPYTVTLAANEPDTTPVSSWKIQWGDGTSQTVPPSTGNNVSLNLVDGKALLAIDGVSMVGYDFGATLQGYHASMTTAGVSVSNLIVTNAGGGATNELDQAKIDFGLAGNLGYGFITFDYNSATDYKYAGIRNLGGKCAWVVGQVDANGMHDDAVLTQSVTQKVSHTYADALPGQAAYQVTATASRGGMSYTAQTLPVTVYDLQLTPGALTTPFAISTIPFHNVTVFHFTDADPNAHATDYSAAVTLGDGNTVTVTGTPGPNGQIVANGNGFDVQLSYTYAAPFNNQFFGVVVTENTSQTIASTNNFTVISHLLTAGGANSAVGC